ncbi:MAG: sigma-70 family RNA polymerase sigma factor [Kofleriaceae bacterium]
MYAAARISMVRARPSPDAALLERLRAGDEAAFTTTVRGLHDTLRRLARLYVRTEAQADEVLQETWLAVVRGLDRFEGRSSFRTWVCSILVNRARTLAVRDARTVPMSALSEDGEVDADRYTAEGRWATPPQAWPEHDPARLVEQAELVAFVGRSLDALPERQRAVALLRDVKGWTSEEVCEALGLSEGNQRVLLHRARAQLRTMLEAHLAGGSS